MLLWCLILDSLYLYWCPLKLSLLGMQHCTHPSFYVLISIILQAVVLNMFSFLFSLQIASQIWIRWSLLVIVVLGSRRVITDAGARSMMWGCWMLWDENVNETGKNLYIILSWFAFRTHLFPRISYGISGSVQLFLIISNTPSIPMNKAHTLFTIQLWL